jgi:hypothetical protein
MDNTVAVAIIGGIFMLIGGFFGGKKFQETKNGNGVLSEIQVVYRTMLDDLKVQNLRLVEDLGNVARINADLHNNNQMLSNQINAMKNEIHELKIKLNVMEIDNNFYRNNFCQKMDCTNRILVKNEK